MTKVFSLLVSLVAFFFYGCSSDSSDGSQGNKYINVSFSGVVVDGYISAASVCLDLNLNSKCDSGEPTTTSANNATFNFNNISVLENSFLPIISTGGTDNSTGKKFIGEFKSVLNTSEINPSVYQNVTPLTDLIAVGFFSGSSRSRTVLDNSRYAVANAYALSDVYVDQNPMAYAGVYSRTQEIQQTVGLLESAVIKAKGTSLTSLERRALREDIKLSLILQITQTGGLDLLTTISKLEYIAGVTFTANEKTFLNAELREIKLSIDELVQHTNLSSYNLTNYQIALEKEADKIYEAVSTMDGTAPITIIPVDINISTILAIVPDSNSSDSNNSDSNNSDNNITIPDPGTDPTTPETTKTKVSFGGYIVDGYINGSKICMDINTNGVCDTNEPSSTSIENGSYTFQNIEVTKGSIIPLIGFSGVDTAINTSRTSELRNVLDTTTAGILNITPITDYISTDFIQQKTKNADSFKKSIDKVASGFGLTASTINADPMQDVATFIISQELEYMRRVLEKVLARTVNLVLQNEIKKAILTQVLEVGYENVSINRVITTLEISLGVFVPEVNRQFAIDQMKEISRFLAEMKTSDEIQTYSLEVLQFKLEAVVSNAINTMQYSAIELSASEVAYSEFSKTDALHDKNSCFQTLKYKNILSDTNSSAAYTSDSKNGMIVHSSIEEITLFYENMNASFTGENTTVFQENYYFSFDQGWIPQAKTIYVRLPKGEGNKYECYRATLDASTASEIELQKVFRYTN